MTTMHKLDFADFKRLALGCISYENSERQPRFGDLVEANLLDEWAGTKVVRGVFCALRHEFQEDWWNVVAEVEDEHGNDYDCNPDGMYLIEREEAFDGRWPE